MCNGFIDLFAKTYSKPMTFFDETKTTKWTTLSKNKHTNQQSKMMSTHKATMAKRTWFSQADNETQEVKKYKTNDEKEPRKLWGFTIYNPTMSTMKALLCEPIDEMEYNLIVQCPTDVNGQHIMKGAILFQSKRTAIDIIMLTGTSYIHEINSLDGYSKSIKMNGTIIQEEIRKNDIVLVITQPAESSKYNNKKERLERSEELPLNHSTCLQSHLRQV